MPSLRHRWTPVAGAALVGTIAVVGWAAWPTLRGPDRRTDVLVVGSGDVTDSTTPLERRVREAGFTVRTETTADWCAAERFLTDLIAQVDPQYVVIGIAARGGCVGDPIGVSLAALHRVHAVVVAEPGDADAGVRASAAARGLTVADPARLLGDTVPATQPCQWWDADCPTGEVEVRDAQGRLTTAGTERLARVVAAEIV